MLGVFKPTRKPPQKVSPKGEVRARRTAKGTGEEEGGPTALKTGGARCNGGSNGKQARKGERRRRKGSTRIGSSGFGAIIGHTAERRLPEGGRYRGVQDTRAKAASLGRGAGGEKSGTIKGGGKNGLRKKSREHRGELDETSKTQKTTRIDEREREAFRHRPRLALTSEKGKMAPAEAERGGGDHQKRLRIPKRLEVPPEEVVSFS